MLTRPTSEWLVPWFRRRFSACDDDAYTPSDICSSAASASGASRFPIGWGFAIVNFVWWIGIGHAGTLISAILLLLRQSWRNSINRFAEAMTLFAVACRRNFSAHSHGPSLAGLLAVSLSQHHELLAAVPQPAGVGRFCRFYLRDYFAAVLVHRPGSRLGHAARSIRPIAWRK